MSFFTNENYSGPVPPSAQPPPPTRQELNESRSYENIDAAAYNGGAEGTKPHAASTTRPPSSAPESCSFGGLPNAVLYLPTQILDKHLSARGINTDLFMSKAFYLCFYAAFGSLFPLIGIYFKQMGMSAAMTGVLIGIRPFIEFCSTPLWGRIAEKWPRPRELLMLSLACWILFTVIIGLVSPEPAKCLVRTSVNESTLVDANGEVPLDEEAVEKFGQALPKGHIYGESPVPLHRYAEGLLNFAEDANKEDYVKPPWSSIVYTNQSVKKAFLLLLLVVAIGEFFSCPAVTLADIATLATLGADSHALYGRQRMFGSLGWGCAMLIIGVTLDQATSFSNHPCGAYHDSHEKNYAFAFGFFGLLMAGAVLVSTQLRFDLLSETLAPLAGTLPMRQMPMDAAHEMSKSGSIDGAPVAQAADNVVAQALSPNYKEWRAVALGHFNMRNAAVLLLAFYMGFGMGIVFAFLFWHLQDIGGSPTLFGIASIFNHFSEIGTYIFSGLLIGDKLTTHQILLACVGANAVRFLCIAALWNAWLIIPFQCIQGVTHALTWSALCAYLSQYVAPDARNAAQGILQSVHHGLGRGCGAIVGGMWASSFGTTALFRGYGIIALFVAVGFAALNFYFPDASGTQQGAFMSEGLEGKALDDNAFPAPHGVPGAGIIRGDLGATTQQQQQQQQQPYSAPQNTSSYQAGAGVRNEARPTGGGAGTFWDQ